MGRGKPRRRDPARRIMPRVPEPEVMDSRAEVEAYRAGDFRRVNMGFARRAARLAGAAAGRAIDLGTGPAEIPIFFLRLRPGWRVTAVDLSPGMLAVARRASLAGGVRDRLRLVLADALEYRTRARYDLVFSNSLLHHVRDPVAFWKAVGRLARPGARILIQDLCRPPNRSAARRLVQRHAREAPPLLRELFYRSLLAAYTPGEVRAQIRAAGLSGLRVRKTTDRHLCVTGRLA